MGSSSSRSCLDVSRCRHRTPSLLFAASTTVRRFFLFLSCRHGLAPQPFSSGPPSSPDWPGEVWTSELRGAAGEASSVTVPPDPLITTAACDGINSAGRGTKAEMSVDDGCACVCREFCMPMLLAAAVPSSVACFLGRFSQKENHLSVRHHNHHNHHACETCLIAPRHPHVQETSSAHQNPTLLKILFFPRVSSLGSFQGGCT